MSGTSASACGTGGSNCSSCGGNQSCNSGQCVDKPCSQTCTGCCSGGTCLSGTSASACGTGGSNCSSCGANQSCSSGQCADKSNQPPGQTAISSTPTTGIVGQAVPIAVTRAVDPDGNTVKVQCTAQDSNFWPNSSAFVSPYSTGGSQLTVSISFTSAGVKTIWCTSFDSNQASGPVATRTISVSSGVNWNCANSSFNGVQYWTCSGGSRYKCTSGVPAHEACGSAGCYSSGTAKDDLCIATDSSWSCSKSSYGGAQWWTCSGGALHKCNSAAQGLKIACSSGCNVMKAGTNDTCK